MLISNGQFFSRCSCQFCTETRIILKNGGLSEQEVDEYLRIRAPQKPITEKGGEELIHADVAAKVLREVTNGAKAIINELRQSGIRIVERHIN
jgi:hypothetical protein